MTDLEGTLIQASAAGVEAIIDVAQDAAEPHDLVATDLHGHLVASYSIPVSHKVVELDLDRLLPNPVRAVGARRFHDPESFGRYVGEHASRATAVYIDLDNAGQQATGILNDHEPAGAAGHGDFVAGLQLRMTSDWKRWCAVDGRPLDQRAFATLIEAQQGVRGDSFIVEPASADLIALVDTLRATATVSVAEAGVTDNGGTSVRYEKDVKVRSGKTGGAEFPRELVAISSVFEGAPNMFRFRVRLVVEASPETGGRVTITPTITLLADIAREAAQECVDLALLAAGEVRSFHGRA